MLEEKQVLEDVPPIFECGEMDVKRIDKFSTASVFGNRYSVPEEYVGKMVDIKIYPENLIFYYNGKKICRHERSYGSQEWLIKLDHYLKTFRNKPGALSGSVALKQSDMQLKDLHKQYYQGKDRDFIELLLYKKEKDKSTSEIAAAVSELEIFGILEITTDKIKSLCERAPIDETSLPSTESETEKMSIIQLSIISSLLNNGAYYNQTGGES